ncbi:glycosyltransferase [Ravibacter arvi]|uniref:Glycosyltransferase n=1 Tax=Ravibacter arvi TaxID=2051041 RepID=A0ABP8LQL7_9BACT
MTPSDWLLLVLLIPVSVQLFFILIVFGRLAFFQSPEREEKRSEKSWMGVSVIVCAWNELENLAELLPLLDAQDYPLFEILVVDDRSSDGTTGFLEAYCRQSAHVRSIRIEKEYEHITPKKYAVTIGQKHAVYEISLMTDADCRPAGTGWISSMVNRMADGKEIVLGFSPYFREKGLLNWLIRCETFYTAVQYFSFALFGMAYMGVGRNLMYRKRLFFENRGFYTHHNVLGGDDDLFINEVARIGNTACNLDPEGYMYSVPKKTWGEWYVQKTRHLGVGKRYRFRFKFLLGILGASHVMVWIAAASLLGWALVTRNQYLLIGTGTLFAVRWLFQWLILSFVNQRMGKTINSFLIPLMDITLFLYYLVMGAGNLFRKKKVARWR